MYDIIIIGAGPAGLTAAIYGKRASKNVLVLEAKSYGGQIINTPKIENYPVAPNISGFEFATNLYNQVTDLGVQINIEKVEKLNDKGNYKEVVTDKNTYQTKTVIIATGSKNRKLGLPQEDELIGKGISYCATCDGAFYKDKIVAVVGGGNTAIEDALYLSNIVSKIYLIHRRDEFRAEEGLVDKLKEKNNIEYVYNSEITSINCDDKITSVDVTNKDGSTKNIEIDGLFVAIGRTPENDIFKDLIELDESGYIVSDEKCRTNIDGIYVAGDNRKKDVRQLVTATSDGAISALEAIKYIDSNR